MAHGKKLSKGRILDINIADICTQIMQPDVPHSLRLQGILIGGVVIVFNKQQLYLFEDLQEMMKRVRTVINIAPTGDQAATLAKGKQRAKMEAITVMSMQHLLGDIMELPMLGAGGQFDLQVPDDLFIVPTLAEDSAGGAPAVSADNRNLHGDDAWLMGAVDQHNHWDQPETFDMPPGGDNLLLDGADELFAMDGGALPDMFEAFGDENALPAAAGDNGEEGGAAAAEGGATNLRASMDGLQPDGGALLQPEEDEQRDEDDLNNQVSEEAQLRLKQQEDEQKKRGGEDEADSATAAKSSSKNRRRQGAVKRKGPRLTVDSLEEIQVRGKLYREWLNNTADIRTARPVVNGRAGKGDGDYQLRAAPAMLQGAAAQWCPELLGLFSAVEKRHGQKGGDGADVADKPGCVTRGKKAAAAPLDLTLAVADEAVGDAADVALPVPDGGLQADYYDDPVPMDMDDNRMEDQLPFADLETERLRAQATPDGNGAAGAGLGLSPGSLPTGMRGGVRRPRPADSGSSDSSLRPESEGGLKSRTLQKRRRTGDARAATAADSDTPLRFGSGNLEDLLPAIEEAAYEADYNHDGSAGRPVGGSGGGGRFGGAGGGSDGAGGVSLTHIPTSQYKLLEESGQPTQALLQECMNKHTDTVLRIFRQRLGLQGTEEGDQAPALSLFQLVQQLSRSEAAKLFYQVCVTTSLGYVKASQAAPYADIQVRAGSRL